MRLVLQRVTAASVRVGADLVGAIGPGLLVLAGVGKDDTHPLARRLARKVAAQRIFPDGTGRLNVSLLEIEGSALVVSQFTLYGETRKGNRPSFAAAAPPDLAVGVLAAFVDELRSLGVEVQEGRFGAHMEVSLVNDGPVTILVEG